MEHQPQDDTPTPVQIKRSAQVANLGIRLHVNLRRCVLLINQAAAKVNDGNVWLGAELMRAAVVLLHATFEDFLRSAGRLKRPDGRWSGGTYNNAGEVSEYIRTLGLNVDDYRQHFDVLTWIMKRRHKIVHKADLASSDDPFSSNGFDSAADQANLSRMVNTVRLFCFEQLFAAVDTRILEQDAQRLTNFVAAVVNDMPGPVWGPTPASPPPDGTP